MKSKTLTWPIFLGTFVISFILVTLLAWIGNQVWTDPLELKCRKQMAILQKAVNQYNRANPGKKLGYMEFGFPGFVEKTLLPDNYLKENIPDLREKHSYYLQRNGFVNCRLHPRNPFSLYLMGLIILTLIATVLVLGSLGYQIRWKDEMSPPVDSTRQS